MTRRTKGERTEAPAPCVFIVDDDVSIRESMELLVQSAGLEVETFASAQEFLSRPPRNAPSCLVLDVNLPAMNGFDLQQELLARDQAMPIIFITGRGDIPIAVKAMKAGALEFLTKPFQADALLEAIGAALAKSQALYSEAEGIYALRARHGSLTARERQVMDLVVEGLLNKQIGARIGAAEPTVKTHRGRVMRKMQASSLAELVRMAAKLKGGA